MVTAIGAEEHSLEVLQEEHALALLSDWSAQSLESLPSAAREVARKCGYLPLAVSLSGAVVRDGVPWLDVSEALDAAELDFLDHPHGSVMKSLKVSVDALRASQAERYLELAAFPKREGCSEQAVLTLWNHTGQLDARAGRKMLIALKSKALLRIDGEGKQRRVSLHDLQYDYLCASWGGLVGLHLEVIEAYQKKCPRGWASGPKDGYFFRRVPWHLREAEKFDELHQLLLTFEWLQAKLEGTDIYSLISDYDYLPQEADLRTVQSVLRQSAHILAGNPRELPGQLIGGLPENFTPSGGVLRRQASEQKGFTWLRPLKPSLIPPNASLVRTLQGHTGSVMWGFFPSPMLRSVRRYCW